MKKIVIYIMLISVILINTVSCAVVEVTNETLEKSLKKLFSKDVQITTKVNGGTGNKTIGAKQIKIENSQIIITEDVDMDYEPINYVLENNKCKFEYKYILDIDESDSFEDAFGKAMNVMVYQSMLEECYLATADALGIDLSLAYTYYYQKYSEYIENNPETFNESNENIDDEIFKLRTISSEEGKKFESYLEIDLQKMSELDDTKLDSSGYATVTLIEKSNSTIEENKSNNTNTNDNFNTKNNTILNNKQNLNNTNKNNSAISDNTQSNKEIPKTGSDFIMKRVCLLIASIAAAILIYNKN